MSNLKRNFLANLIGKAWYMLSSLLFAPFLIRMLGLEAYGLIGFSLTMNAVISLLDMGLSATMNREMAKMTAEPGQEQEARNLTRSMEIIYWPIALLIVGIVLLSSSFIAKNWLHPGPIPASSVQAAVVMMGLSIALQWPYTLYEGGLLGLQKQQTLNIITVIAATARTAGALLILAFFGRTIHVYFLWQIIVNASMTLAVAATHWRSLPHAPRPPWFDSRALIRIWRYAAGITGISLVSLILVQADKVLVARALNQQAYGCYTLAASLSNTLLLGAAPFFTVLFPRFVILLERRDHSALASIYHFGCQALAITLLPAAMLMTVFSHELISLLAFWTGRPLFAGQTDRVLVLLAVGTTCNVLLNLPYALQLASGWTKLAFSINSFLAIFQVPVLVFLLARFGAPGAAAVWALIGLIQMAVMIPLMHRRLLPTEMIRWCTRDILLPLGAVLLVTVAARTVLKPTDEPLVNAARLAAIWALATISGACAAPAIRQAMLTRIALSRPRRFTLPD